MGIGKRYIALGLILVLAFVFTGCAPGNERWNQEISPGNKAGFWAGVWHGLIIVITFIVSLFTKDVGLYEVNNTGWPYNLGFLIGLCFAFLAPWRWGHWRHRKLKKKDWEHIGDMIEEKVREKIKVSLEGTKEEEKDKEWEEIAKMIEEKIKKHMKDWVEKE